MNEYTNSITWKKTLGVEGKEKDVQVHIDTLRNSYISIRKKAEYLASEIVRYMPEYTVHDITHIDALWEATDLILPFDYEINPVEGYVLGVAFLFHDLGMGLTAYSNGIQGIKEKSIWKDTVATEFKKKYGHEISEDNWENIDQDIEKIALENALRILHAEQASKLPMLEWEFQGRRENLIDETCLREAYGEVIGMIAYSHWWGSELLKNEFSERCLGALSSFPMDWTVDVLKLACILRIADAIQIDDRRAPIFLMKLRKPLDISRLHWIFQSKLYQPMVQNERIVYTTKSAFEIDEMEAWWTCYDTLKMIDDELKNIDTILAETNHKKLNASGVCGIASAKDLSKYIRVNGWFPVDVKIKVGNVGKLVANLGGRQLYGENILVPIRELIQNGADAVRARRLLEEDDYIGNITFSYYEKGEDCFIEIEDDGVGMSQNVLVGPFLDFGQSFWNTQLMFEELPGLSSKGFSSTGQYGIGFYSVFMWSNDVKVITKRYDAAREDTLVLEFKYGTSGRPILRRAQKSEQIKDGGTKIIIKISSHLMPEIMKMNYKKETIGDTIAKICPCLDCNLWVKESEKYKVISANDWLEIEPDALLKRLVGPNEYSTISLDEKALLESLSENMQIIEKDGIVYGRAFIYRMQYWYRNSSIGCVVLGGFKASPMMGIAGVFLGESIRASRELGRPLVEKDVLRNWVEKQCNLINEKNLGKEEQLDLAETIVALGVRPMDLYIAEKSQEYLRYRDICEYVMKNDFDEVILVQDAAISNKIYDLPEDIEVTFLDNIIWCSTGRPCILQSESNYDWPLSKGEWEYFCIHTMVEDAILEAWGIDGENKEKHVLRSTDEEYYSAIVGKVAGKDWTQNYVTKLFRNEIN